MKTRKKILFGLGTVFVLLLASSLFLTRSALADIPINNFSSATYTYTGSAGTNSPIRVVVKNDAGNNVTLNFTFRNNVAGFVQYGIDESANPDLCSAGLLRIQSDSITKNPATGYISISSRTNGQCLDSFSSAQPNGPQVSITNPNPASTPACNPQTDPNQCQGGGPVTPGGICSNPGQTSGELTCGNCSSQGCVWTTNTQTAVDANSSCLDADTLSLGWIFCKIFQGVDNTVRSFYGLVEDQLCFKAGDSSTNSGVNCDSSGNTNFLSTQPPNNGVFKAWSTFRVIATSLLVIAMLIMVISQATGAGPLDAYTVRRLLPRMVAVAILIQISWYLTKFTIDVFNDIGRGLEQLMYAPFGGKDAVNIASALGEISTGTQVALGLGVIFTAGVVAFSGLTVVGMLMLALPVVLAVIVGYFVLLLRQILIIVAVLFAPVALVMWIIPGTERYWKLWRETFVKLLVMFPMIVALIAAGRIFGTIGGQALDGVAGFVIVLVGFFGPLLMLPKTFNWGGAALGTMSNAAFNGTRGIRRKPAELATGAAQQNRAQRSANRALRLAEGKSAGLRGYADRTFAGRYNPLKKGYVTGGVGTTVGKAYASTVAQGREEAEKAFAQSLVVSGYEGLSHPEKLEALANVAQGNKDAGTGIDGSNPIAQRWALDEFANLGDWDKISDLRDRGVIDNHQWEKFVAKNIGAIHQKAPHLSPLKSDLSTSISPEEMPGWHAEGFDELRRQFHGGYKRNRDGAIETINDPEELRAHRQRIKDIAGKAASNEYIAGRFTTDNLEKVQSLANADIDTPTARYVPPARGTRGPGTVDLPQDMGTPEAQASMRELLTSRSGYFAPAARQAIAQKVAQTPAGSPEDVHIRSIVDGLKSQSATSEVAKSAHTELSKSVEESLNQVALEAEQHAVASGRSADEIASIRTSAQQFKQQKLESLGLADPPQQPEQSPTQGGLDIDHSDEK
jgi:hypothetical protein